MKHQATPPQSLIAVIGVIVVANVAGGCGNLSNEDLIFLGAVPRSSEVAIEVEDVPGAKETSTALVAATTIGQPAIYHAWAVAIATELNSGVGNLLDMVGGLGHGHPPTIREKNRRVWGPVQNVDDSGKTIRLEISRATDPDSGAPVFSFCLQIGLDSDYNGGVGGCDLGNAAGLATILWGTFSPRASQGERGGAGEIHCDFEAARSLGGDSQMRGMLTVSFDFTPGGKKAIAESWTLSTGLGQAPQSLQYFFNLSETGEVDFYFQTTRDLIEVPTTGALETVTIGACWSRSGPGRAGVLVRGGDLLPGHAAYSNECWDRDFKRTFFELVVTQDPTTNVEQGDRSTCPDC